MVKVIHKYKLGLGSPVHSSKTMAPFPSFNTLLPIGAVLHAHFRDYFELRLLSYVEAHLDQRNPRLIDLWGRPHDRVFPSDALQFLGFFGSNMSLGHTDWVTPKKNLKKKRLEGWARSIAFSSDGQFLAVYDDRPGDYPVSVWGVKKETRPKIIMNGIQPLPSSMQQVVGWRQSLGAKVSSSTTRRTAPTHLSLPPSIILQAFISRQMDGF